MTLGRYSPDLVAACRVPDMFSFTPYGVEVITKVLVVAILLKTDDL